MLKTCIVFWESEPQYAYKRYAYEKTMYRINYAQLSSDVVVNFVVHSILGWLDIGFSQRTIDSNGRQRNVAVWRKDCKNNRGRIPCLQESTRRGIPQDWSCLKIPQVLISFSIFLCCVGLVFCRSLCVF